MLLKKQLRESMWYMLLKTNEEMGEEGLAAR
jgi:hypothetical protein